MSEAQFSIMLSRLLMVISVGQSKCKVLQLPSSSLNLIAGIEDNSSSLTHLSDCTCLGYVQTFECVVFGAGITIWQGTGFDFPCVIQLRHSQYNNSRAIGDCNDGAIIASSVGVLGDRYISQLNVTITQEMTNETIKCMHEDILGNRSIIGRKTLLSITTGNYCNSTWYHN